jgi:transcriptional regulator with XRE-family HTH domain
MPIGERLKKARKKNGISQDELAKTIGVSRGVITNIEYEKIEEPQAIIIDAIAKTLNINKKWLLTGEGEMEELSDTLKSAKILAELYDVAKGLSEDEQLYLLDMSMALKKRFGNNEPGTHD